MSEIFIIVDKDSKIVDAEFFENEVEAKIHCKYLSKYLKKKLKVIPMINKTQAHEEER